MRANGFSLIELLIAVAIISIIAAIAIPAYEGYVVEAHLGSARANADTLRVFLEEYHLNNSTYKDGGSTSFNKAQLESSFGWSPDGDNNKYTYAVTAATNSWDIVVEHTAGHWIRCEDRMSNCCDSDTSGASKTACP